MEFFFFFSFIQDMLLHKYFFKIFAQICPAVIYKEMFESLRSSVSEKTF